MAGDQPFFAIPFVSVGKACLHLLAVTEREGVQTSVKGSVAIDLYGMRIDLATRFFFQKMSEVVELVFTCQ